MTKKIGESAILWFWLIAFCVGIAAVVISTLVGVEAKYSFRIFATVQFILAAVVIAHIVINVDGVDK